jgi:hypothetical protein
MSNTERSKNLIAEAICSLSDDFTLSDARVLLSRALNEIQHVESKRAKRENIKPVASTSFAESRVATNSPTARESTQWTRDQVMATLNAIDKQIAEEKQKLEDMKKPKASPPSKISDDLNGLING